MLSVEGSACIFEKKIVARSWVCVPTILFRWPVNQSLAVSSYKRKKKWLRAGNRNNWKPEFEPIRMDMLCLTDIVNTTLSNNWKDTKHKKNRINVRFKDMLSDCFSRHNVVLKVEIRFLKAIGPCVAIRHTLSRILSTPNPGKIWRITLYIWKHTMSEP